MPLILRLPDGRWAGRQVEEQVSLVDVLPSILELLGLPPPPDLRGQSFVPLLQGGGPGPRPLAFSQLAEFFTQGGSARTTRLPKRMRSCSPKCSA